VNIKADLKKGFLYVNDDLKCAITCRVRTVANGLRLSNEVVYTIPGKMPYMPMMFPTGKWAITEILWQKDKDGKDLFHYDTYGPVKICTDAFQWVPVWDLDFEGDYLNEASQLVQDRCYWLHYSKSSSTLGCIRITSPEDAILVGKLLEEKIKKGEPCTLEVPL